ncbi:hypothetical protein [Haloferax elongans]|uniref:hypothetical protein n=1 Tax=Haloferax elongans TaxID=403191 RepID=UPI000B009893|nr:hypothetical protein [Haloferax elongans]
MPDGRINFPECCGYCPHRQRFSAACSHDLRQSLVFELAAAEKPCPVFDDWHAREMSRLERELPTGADR